MLPYLPFLLTQTLITDQLYQQLPAGATVCFFPVLCSQLCRAKGYQCMWLHASGKKIPPNILPTLIQLNNHLFDLCLSKNPGRHLLFQDRAACVCAGSNTARHKRCPSLEQVCRTVLILPQSDRRQQQLSRWRTNFYFLQLVDTRS